MKFGKPKAAEITMHIHVGQGNPDGSITSAFEQQVIVGWWAIPRVGDYISGRNTDGQQYRAKVAWVTHEYEYGCVNVYAYHT